MSRQWSHYQLEIFKDVNYGQGHTVVEALAGSGKTTSIIEALKYIPPGNSWLLVAFNKKIAEELRFRAPPGGEIKTLHALGLKAISKYLKKINIDDDKTNLILDKILKSDVNLKNLKYQISKAVSLAKGYLATTPEEVDNIIDLHEICTETLSQDTFIKIVLEVLQKSKELTSIINYDDMIWFPNVISGIKVPQYNRVFVDEAQDLNKAQIELILKTIKQPPKRKTKTIFTPTRVMAIGDRNQALYAFRGADSKAIDNIISNLGAKILPLSVTYRCPLAIVKEAQKLVPTLEAAPHAPEGKVEWISDKEMRKKATPGCFILSRTNAPLVALAMDFLKKRIPCNIQGRDIGENLLNLIKVSKTNSIKNFLAFIDRWSKSEIERLQGKNKDINHILDKVSCFQALAEGCFTLTELQTTIGKLFDDSNDQQRIILSTVHRAKGLERDIVYILNYTFILGSSQEEKNARYVAITRCKDSLFFVYKENEENQTRNKILDI